MMKVNDFIKKLKDMDNRNTIYATGMFCNLITDDIINYKKIQYPKQYVNTKVEYLKTLVGRKYYGSDCLGLIKGILWGYPDNGKYGSNNVPDFSENEMINKYCTTSSTDFSKIVPGAVLYMTGHVGVYIGDGKVIESSTKWENGIQTTYLGNISKYKNGHYRIWTKWGKLKFIDYTEITKKVEVDKVAIELCVLKKGMKDGINGITNIKAMQTLLNRFGYGLDIDGSYGPATEKAVKDFQTKNATYKNIDGSIDGVCGKNTWFALHS